MLFLFGPVCENYSSANSPFVMSRYGPTPHICLSQFSDNVIVLLVGVAVVLTFLGSSVTLKRRPLVTG